VGLRTPAVVRLVGALAHVGHSVFVEPSRTRRACVARLGRASHVPASTPGPFAAQHRPIADPERSRTGSKQPIQRTRWHG
jgi:hypothetical protein